MRFDAIINGKAVPMDANPDFGGTDYGVSPKQLMLAALNGCYWH